VPRNSNSIAHPSAVVSLPKVALKSRRALPFFNRHPWVFAGAIERVEGELEPGTEVALLSSRNEFIARGLYNPTSNIRVRLYSWREEEALDREFWSKRIDEALALRRLWEPPDRSHSAIRLIYSEGDGLSGLIVDRYGEWLGVQFTSLALAKRREMIVGLLREKLQPSGIWLRTEKGIRESEGLDLCDGLLAGIEPPRPLFIDEHGIRYGVDICQGQKTGFYLDQRDNRAAIARYVNGHRVLDLFCYTGGFGLAAVKLGGAREVVGVDVSESALAMARANVELNGVSDKFHFERSKVFDILESLQAAGKRFDTVVLDPPKMTRHRAGIKQALRGYHSLNRMAVDLLRPGGLLVSCSCSGLIGRNDFEQMLADVSVRADRPLRILEARGQGPDHPVSVHCPENNYLKCNICRVE
jgi:23S rRNA (cytosine1962-C5)-methyltransferase